MLEARRTGFHGPAWPVALPGSTSGASGKLGYNANARKASAMRRQRLGSRSADTFCEVISRSVVRLLRAHEDQLEDIHIIAGRMLGKRAGVFVGEDRFDIDLRLPKGAAH